MNVAVFGWYHHRNAGDDRIQEALTRWLDGHTLAFLPAGRRVPTSFLRTYDLALIGGGGILMRRGGVIRDLAGKLRRAGVPAALVGVSVEDLPGDLRRELRRFLDSPSCVFAWLRDQGSLDAVGEHPKAFVGPDLTWMYPVPPARGEGSGTAVCLRRRADLPRERWSRVLEGLPAPLRPWPLYFEGEGDAWSLGPLDLGEPVPESFTLDPLLASRAVVSSRFHGILFALQAGRPVIAVGAQPKIVRFLEENGLSRWRVPEDAPEALPPLWEDFEDARDELLERVGDVASDIRGRAGRLAEEVLPRLEEAGGRAAGSRVRRLRTRLDRFVDRWI
jgi:polysaccharide pyruvyl transferase WcaK-like protein